MTDEVYDDSPQGPPSNENASLETEIHAAVTATVKKLSDPEIFRALKHEYTDEVFQKVRNQLLLWVAPFLAAAAILGWDIYKTRNQISTQSTRVQELLTQIQTDFEKRKDAFDFFFANDQRATALRMLVLDFHNVRTLRIPLAPFFYDDAAQSRSDAAAPEGSTARYLFGNVVRHSIVASLWWRARPDEEHLIDYDHQLEVDYNLENRDSSQLYLTLKVFRPLSPLTLEELENASGIAIELRLNYEDANPINYVQGKQRFRNPYNYNGLIANTSINDIPIVPPERREDLYLLSGDEFVRHARLVELTNDSAVIRFEVDVSRLFPDVVAKYEGYYLRGQ